MGQKLSCFSKTKEESDGAPGPKKIKLPLKRSKRSKACAEKNEIETTAANQLQSAAPTSTFGPREPIELLKPAPSTFKPPKPLRTNQSDFVTASKSLNTSDFAQPSVVNRASTVYSSPTVDQTAREIGRNKARPATWADLYYNLVAQRKLTSDEDRVKALFSWLCSIPLGRDAFVTLEDLQEAAKADIQYAKEACKVKSANPDSDSPEVVVNELTRGKSTYLRAFESLCRYANIPCYTIKGIAKGVDYTVGMRFGDQQLMSGDQVNPALARMQHAWSAALLDGRWALFDCIWAAERLAVSANVRASQATRLGQMDHETDMFYFNADPAKFIFSHFPFDSRWQLLNPPVSLQQFEQYVLLKPSFFTHGLGLFSHQEGVIPVQTKLILTLSIPSPLINTLLFTFNLRTEGGDESLEGHSLARLGIHEISRADLSVTFNFRFPKAGAYRLTIYARKIGDQYFTDICEYRVEAKGPSTPSVADKETGEPRRCEIPLFPPTSQSDYGPTEKANEFGITTVPHALNAQLKTLNGILEVCFASVNHNGPLPRLMARLKTLLKVDPVKLDCLLIRTVEPGPTGSRVSLTRPSSCTEASMPMVVVSAYLPAAGEYALEVYGAPADAEEDTSYFLVWQFLVDSELGIELDSHVCQRLLTANLGPQDDQWGALGLRPHSHWDPVIRVPSSRLMSLGKNRSNSELIQQFAERSNELRPISTDTAGNASNTNVEEPIGPRSADLTIVIEKTKDIQLCIIGQLVDISEQEEEDRTLYLLQLVDEPVANGELKKSLSTITYLVRIPKGGHFYKLYIYATPVGTNPNVSIPLVYTYLIDAPARVHASELPYIGAKAGPFPEKQEAEKEKSKETS